MAEKLREHNGWSSRFFSLQIDQRKNGCAALISLSCSLTNSQVGMTFKYVVL